MLTADFDFDLPDELIAQRPAERGQSRMLVLQGQRAAVHSQFSHLPDYLCDGDLLVVNDTRVIPARLFAHRQNGGLVEILLVEKLGETSWFCLAKPGRKARPGVALTFSEELSAEVVEKRQDGLYLLRFSAPVEGHLDKLGSVPLPPYIKRPAEAGDRVDYQTIFASRPGAIAAPTAGLHFTAEIESTLGAIGVDIQSVTLHVGIGTFKPVTTDLVHEHVMETERYEIPPATAAAIAATRHRGGRVIAVGTTVVRTLEGAAAVGLPLESGRGRTNIFIRPGHEFAIVDGLLTNFHLPKSTLLMLVSALVGRERILAAYRQAVEAGYRFFSYGDATLLLP